MGGCIRTVGSRENVGGNNRGGCLFLETGSLLCKAGLELGEQPKVTLSSWSITYLVYIVLGIKPRPLCLQGKQSSDWKCSPRTIFDWYPKPAEKLDLRWCPQHLEKCSLLAVTKPGPSYPLEIQWYKKGTTSSVCFYPPPAQCSFTQNSWNGIEFTNGNDKADLATEWGRRVPREQTSRLIKQTEPRSDPCQSVHLHYLPLCFPYNV